MTKEQIEARIKELETAREQTRGNFMAIEGALQELHNWLGKLNTTPVTEEKKKK